ncbi:VOC family protein [Luteolibacter arcticus]|uniref:VOC family protein n=1 Tax=Luteolibacter arcticus TaxID=1581411 RepID=A0ABT3GHI2_9BACT|nr:VOC family protein [Luteolibacter arcticus]MCW1922758.1 VOC family protein [Luteolibacter arcticus]
MNGIGIKEAGFTGYPALDIAATRKFYGEIMGLKEGMVLEHEGKVGWVEFEIPGGHTLAIAQANEQWQPNAGGGGLAFELEDLDAAVEKLKAAGVKVILPVQDYPICRMALIADPSGNTVALHQKKPNHPECSH